MAILIVKGFLAFNMLHLFCTFHILYFMSIWMYFCLFQQFVLDMLKEEKRKKTLKRRKHYIHPNSWEFF